MATIEWTGLEATLLSEALGLSHRRFATLLGVVPSTTMAWRNRRAGINIKPLHWPLLNEVLEGAAIEQKTVFDASVAKAKSPTPPPQTEAEPEAELQPISMDGWTGDEAYLLFKALRMTVRDGASWLKVDPSTISRWRQRGPVVLPNDTQDRLNGALRRASTDVGARFDAALAEFRAARGTAPLSLLVDVLGPAGTLDAIDTRTRAIIKRYESEGPRLLAPEVRALLNVCRGLGSRVSSKRERSRLAKASAEQAALLAYMSVNLSRFADAEFYAFEAGVLAEHLDDRPMMAWLRGTQSFAAYYQKDYGKAQQFAEIGLDLAGDDPSRIRLLSNGLARAAGKRGDRRTVDRALGEALELARSHTETPGMTSCIDLQPYSWPRTAANAATAYLSVGDKSRVLDLTRELAAVVAESDSDWSRSLVALDEATALTLGSDPDVERAASVGLTALDSSRAKPIASVVNRAGELAVSLERHGPHPATQQFANALHEWRDHATELTS